MFQSLGIASEIISDGCHMEEVAFWNPSSHSGTGKCGGKSDCATVIERTNFAPDVQVPARFPFEVTIHQGRIERILQQNLQLYAPEGVVRRSHRFVEYTIDSDNNAEFPILVHYEYDLADGTIEKGALRTKYLVGADGARSRVRKCMGLELQGETTDHIWGVCDFVADTDFPDIRKRCAVHSDAGSVMVIPREQIASGDYLTRLYVQVPGQVAAPDTDAKADKKTADKKRRNDVTLEYIFEQARSVFAPYKMDIKANTAPDWWAAYQIGQRMTPEFSATTPDGVARIFIVGDGKRNGSYYPLHLLRAAEANLVKACHTHSPKAGQGMNVSMMDSYNLAWKLAHTLHGLTPQPSPDAVLQTFGSERVDIARKLIEFDKEFSHLFSGQFGPPDAEAAGFTHDDFLRVFSEGSGFTSGCGLCYKPSLLVKAPNNAPEASPLHDALVPGKRLRDVLVKRYADATTRHLHDGKIPGLVVSNTTINH